MKEARAKESQPFDIFSIAGVSLPTGNSSIGSLNMTNRHDGHVGGLSIGSVKRPRRERPTQAAIEDSSEGKVNGDNPLDMSATGLKSKLKRSSMAARTDNTVGVVSQIVVALLLDKYCSQESSGHVLTIVNFWLRMHQPRGFMMQYQLVPTLLLLSTTTARPLQRHQHQSPHPKMTPVLLPVDEILAKVRPQRFSPKI